MRKIFNCLIVVGVILFLVPDVSAQSGRKSVLDNGMTVVVSPMPQSPTVSIYALVKTGSATEGRYLGTGISHFVEHMLFKGTKKRGVGVIPAEVKALGGRINASTGFDFTIYTLDVPSESFVQGLDLITDMVTNSVFDPAEVNREREVIFGEMRMINDRPERKLGDLLFQNAYLRHPYHHPIIGYVPLFGRITQEELVDYYKTHYIPNNIVLSIAGNVEVAKVLPLVQKAFKDFSPKPYVLRNLPVEPVQTAKRRSEIGYPSQTTRLAMAFQGVSSSSEDMFALDVLSMVLGGGSSSRLYSDVVKKKKLVDSIGASNYTPTDAGVFEISSDFEKGDVDGVIEAVWGNILEVQQKGVTPDELDKAVHQIMRDMVYGKQLSSSVAYNSAVNEAFLGDYDFDQKYLDRVKRLTPADIQRVARQYLVQDRLTIVALKPESDLVRASSRSVSRKGSEILKEILPNGLTILVKEDHNLPLATMYVAMRAGARQEPKGENGLNQLTADLWSQGAGAWNSSTLSEMVESRGAVLSSSGGYNSMGLRLDFLSGDLAFAMDVIEASVKRPRFDADDFERQRDLEIANIRQSEDNILQVGIDHLRETVFLHHPLRINISGNIEDLRTMRRDQVVDYYQTYLSAGHMVVALYGDFDGKAVMAELKRRFESVPQRSVELVKAEEGFPQTVREKILKRDKEQAAVLLGFRAPDIFSPDRATMEILSSILGSSLNGRLFIKIREELGKAYTLGASYSPSLDGGLIVFYVLTTNDQVDKVREILSKELHGLGAAPVSSAELNAAKASLKSQFATEMHTIGQLTNVTALDELYGLGYDNYLNYNSKLDAVTPENVQKIAGEYLDTAHASWVIVQSSAKE